MSWPVFSRRRRAARAERRRSRACRRRSSAPAARARAAPGRRANRTGRRRRAAAARAPRSVIRSAWPGPAPTKTTRRGRRRDARHAAAPRAPKRGRARARRPGSGRRGRSASARSATSRDWSARSSGRVEAGARQQRQHVDEHLAGGADLAREAIARAQQARLAVGAAVGPLRETQRDARSRGRSATMVSTSTSFGRSRPAVDRPASHACHCDVSRLRARRGTARASSASPRASGRGVDELHGALMRAPPSPAAPRWRRS